MQWYDNVLQSVSFKEEKMEFLIYKNQQFTFKYSQDSNYLFISYIK